MNRRMLPQITRLLFSVLIAGCTTPTPEALRARIDQPVVRTVPANYGSVYRHLLDRLRHQYGGRSMMATSGLDVEGDLFAETKTARILILAVTFTAETGCVVDIDADGEDCTQIAIYTAWPHVRSDILSYLDRFSPSHRGD